MVSAIWNDVLLKLILAALLAGLIGFERERKDKPAGLRTHMLVSTACALITLVSVESFNTINPDSVSRIIAGILTGIGFLGAGTIMRTQDHVEGLTTAASVWVVSVIGISVGLGYYLHALFGTIVIMGILLLSGFERTMHKHRYKK